MATAALQVSCKLTGWFRCHPMQRSVQLFRVASHSLYYDQHWRTRCARGISTCVGPDHATIAAFQHDSEQAADDGIFGATLSEPSNKNEVMTEKRQGLSALLGRKSQQMSAGLYLVATPIGNLEDITIRALSVLSAADTVLAEDCRRTRMLLNAYGISANLRSYHMHNETQRSTEVIKLLQQGQVVALVSDAGTPGISDPGSVAVAATIEAGFRVIPVPGPAAAIAALVGSGLPTLEFHFAGFLPAKSTARIQSLQSLRERVKATMIFYVPPHGLLDTLTDMISVLGGHRRCCVTRELTKIHETFHRDSLANALTYFSESGVKGEVTLCVAGSTEADLQSADPQKMSPQERLRELLAEGVSVSVVSKQVAAEYGMRKKESYAMALEIAGVQQGQTLAKHTRDATLESGEAVPRKPV